MKLKKVLATVAALTLTGGLAIGGTLAYFNAETAPVTNNFTASGGFYDDDDKLLIKLVEPAWTNAVEKAASDFKPGDTFAKDPQIKNNSTLDAYVAIKVVFYVNGEKVDYNTFDSQANIQYYDDTTNALKDGINTADWSDLVLYDNGTPDITTDDYYVAYYKTSLDKKATTDTLFDSVLIPSNLDDDSIADFDIELTGYAIQSANISNAKAALETEFFN